MAREIVSGTTSNRIRVLLDKTGLTFNSAGLRISTIADNESSATVYAQGSSNIEDITTLGTFAAPTSGKCRFKEVDATNHPGLYEIQLADARLAVANARSLIVSISGGGISAPAHYEIELPAGASGLKSVNVPDKTGYSLANGSIASATFAAGAIDAAAIATDALGSLELAAGAATEIAQAVRTELATELARVDVAISTRLASASYTAPPSASSVASAVHQYLYNGMAVDGSFEDYVRSYLDVTVSSRLASASYTAPANSDIAAIKAKTDQLNFTVAGQVDANSLTGGMTAADVRSALGMASANLDLQLSTIDDFVDTEVAAIKVVTDKLNSAMELDGSVYRFTANALERGPGGATVLDANLVSVNGSTILAGDFNFTVSAGGKLYQGKLDLVPGDEYLEADGTAITFTDGNFPDLDGFTTAKLTVKVGASVIIDHHSTNDLSEASKTVSFDMPEEVSSLLADYVGLDAEFDVEAHRADGSFKTIARGPAKILDPLD